MDGHIFGPQQRASTPSPTKPSFILIRLTEHSLLAGSEGQPFPVEASSRQGQEEPLSFSQLPKTSYYSHQKGYDHQENRVGLSALRESSLRPMEAFHLPAHHFEEKLIHYIRHRLKGE